MRLTLLTAFSIAAGLGACVPAPVSPYGYAPAPAPAASYGYYDGGYAPAPYYVEPSYAPYVTPGPAIIIGGERRFDGGGRYRDEGRRNEDRRNEGRRNEGDYRGNPNPSNRDFGRSAPPQNFGGNRAGPMPVAAARPGPGPQAVPPAPSGGAAFEQWNRTHVNASPSLSDTGPR